MTGIALRDCGCGCAVVHGDAICPCEDVHGPWWIVQPERPAAAIAYRVGDFGSFRHELVRHLARRAAARDAWRPSSADGDLALQIVDWFAIVADILTFYSERIANEAYLGTAAAARQRAAARRRCSAIGRGRGSGRSRRSA